MNFKNSKEKKLTSNYKLILLGFIVFFPINIYSISGFEITPSLLLSFLIPLFIRTRQQLNIALVSSSVVIIGLSFSIVDNTIKNLLSSMIVSTSLIYLIFGHIVAKNSYKEIIFSYILLPILLFIVIILSIDYFFLGSEIRGSGSYSSTSYSSNQASFIQSFFPFYGKYGVLTFSSICVMILFLCLPLINEANKKIKFISIIACSLMAFFIFKTSSIQVLLGMLIFIIIFIVFELKVISGILFFFSAILTFLVTYYYSQELLSAIELLPFKLQKFAQNFLFEDLNSATSGRWNIYTYGINNIEAKIVLIGCGFCDLKQNFDFGFSSLHNSILTSIYKGGIPLLILMFTPFFVAITKLVKSKRSTNRSIYLASLTSILTQSLSWDLLFLQTLSPILYAFCGFIIWKKNIGND